MMRLNEISDRAGATKAKKRLGWLSKEEAVDGAILAGAQEALEQLRGLNQELRRFKTAVDWKSAGP